MAIPEELANSNSIASQQVNDLFDSPEFAKAVETEEFRLFLDHLPIALVISKLLRGDQRIIFANKAYEEMTGQRVADIRGRGWAILDVFKSEDDPNVTMAQALLKWEDYLGAFRLESANPILVEGYAGIIENDDGVENYRIVAIIDVTVRERTQREEFARKLQEKDTLLKELQHRVRNNLQLITALIRMDARNQCEGSSVNLDRLAGRIESLQLLYKDLSVDGLGQAVDLGHYISEIAAAVMHTYTVEGIRLDLKVDSAPASINVAMPVGLVVNELLTNAFKHAFNGRGSGTLPFGVCTRKIASIASSSRTTVSVFPRGQPGRCPVSSAHLLCSRCASSTAPGPHLECRNISAATRVSIWHRAGAAHNSARACCLVTFKYCKATSTTNKLIRHTLERLVRCHLVHQRCGF
jgi:PAS domain S-box-containing protein